MSGAYYNEIDPYAAQWLRNLIAAGHIAPGDVDERDIRLVRADDLRGYTQCHFFAGIGVWSYALRLAGWPDDEPVWTGSCPCQPFSSAGRKGGFNDERHLWPNWKGLIIKSRPHAIFGEQVADADGLAWLDFVCADLEAEGYAIGALDTSAAGFGAPHIRQRLYWVAHAESPALAGAAEAGNRASRDQAEQPWRGASPGRRSDAGWMATHTDCAIEDERAPSGEQPLCDERNPAGFWGDVEWIYCGDGCYRPVEPGTFPLAHGVADRMEQVRAYGNAIVSENAAEFIRAYRMTEKNAAPQDKTLSRVCREPAVAAPECSRPQPHKGETT
jgi:DNA (cytosine-5)-methyltransferase 1